MESHVELPVNKNHHIRSGTTFAGLYSIMTSDAYAGKLNVVLSEYTISEGKMCFDFFQNRETFQIEQRRLIIDDERDRLKICSNPFVDDKYAYIFKRKHKKIGGETQLQIRVDFLQESNAWSNVKLIMSKGIQGYNQQYRESVFLEEYSLRLTAKGKLVLQSPNYHTSIQIRETDKQQAVYLRMESGIGWCAKYSFDGENWETIYETEDNCPAFLELGVYVSPKISPFFYEFFPCYLQLCFSRATKVMVPHVETEDRYFSSMLETYHLPSEVIEYSGEELVDYFIKLLAKKYYIRLRLNEFYVPETPSYQKLDFAHVNYLYGYDRVKRVFKVIGYNKYLLFTEISFDDFVLSFNYKKHLNNKITLYKYNCKSTPQEFPIEETISNLKSYLQGRNSYLVTPNREVVTVSNDSFVYGIKIFDEIANNNEYIDSFIRDVRLAYRLQERYLIIRNMLELMMHIRILSKEVYEQQTSAFQALFLYVETIKEMILKHYVKSIPDIHKQIGKMLKILKKKDENTTRKLVETLESRK